MAWNFRRELIVGIAFIAGSLLVFGVIGYFLSSVITAEAEKISQDRMAIQKHSQLIEGLANQKASSPEVKKYQQAIDLLLPQKDNLVNFSGWLDGLSRAHQVSANFSFNGDAVASDGQSAGYIRFVLNANGEYSDLISFLRDVELKAPQYTTSFDDFDMKRTGSNYNVVVSGRVFFR